MTALRRLSDHGKGSVTSKQGMKCSKVNGLVPISLWIVIRSTRVCNDGMDDENCIVF